jgi:hypothetical protein
MKIGFAFLLKDSFPHQSYWHYYFRNAHPSQYCFLAHCYTGKYKSDYPLIQVPTVQTSWHQTINAHFELYREALKRGCDKIMLLSESCLPVQPFDQFWNFLERRPLNNSHFNRLLATAPFEKRVKKMAKKVQPFAKQHSQWSCISAKDAEHLLKNEKDVKASFQSLFADNEHFSATYLNYLGKEYQVEEKLTFAHWPNQPARHPYTFTQLDKEQIEKIRNYDYYFARKFHSEGNYQELYSYI